MKTDMFVTPTYSGNIKWSDKTIAMFKNWVKFEKELNPEGDKESTTQGGWQYVFKPGDIEPDWLREITPSLNTIKEEIGFDKIKTMWVVDYNAGGYQDPHFHSVGVIKVSTIIFNILGNGELVVQDPRQLAMGQGYGFAYEHKFSPGDWLSMPAYLIHNSRPSPGPRSILVIDCFVK
jgi:hypothetical protein